MADLVLTESTVATRGETTSSYGTRCCTKARAEELGCTVTAPADATSKQLITGAKGNLPNLEVTMAGWTYGETAKNPSVTGNTGGGTVTYTYKAEGSSSYSSTKPSNAGTHTVKATVAETTNYISKSVTTTFTVAKKDREVTITFGKTGVFVGDSISVSATTTGDGSVSLTTTTSSIITVSSGTVKGVADGLGTVKATVAATTNYNSATVTKNIRVSDYFYIKISSGSLSGVGSSVTELRYYYAPNYKKEIN